MTNTVFLTKENGIAEVVKELQNLDVNEVLLEIENKEDTHIGFSIYYSKERKRFSISVQPLVYKEEYGCASRSFMMFSGASNYLNNTPIARKSPKQEASARAMVTVDMLNGMIDKIKNDKRR